MPEGDTIYSTAVTLRKALLDKRVTRFETSVPSAAAADLKAPIAGSVTPAVEARGKHPLITFAAPAETPAVPPASPTSYPPAPPPPSKEAPDPSPPQSLVLRTHLRMTGSWHLYRPGERW